MGEWSVYFVPFDQDACAGRSHAVAEAFWTLGVFLATDDNFIYKRIKDWQDAARSLPDWDHDFSFGAMGLGDEVFPIPVPQALYDLQCPACQTNVWDIASDLWQEDSDLAISEREITCPGCEAPQRSDGLVAPETPFTFARFYLWVSDIDADWDPTFQATVERVLGPCRVFKEWDT